MPPFTLERISGSSVSDGRITTVRGASLSGKTFSNCRWKPCCRSLKAARSSPEPGGGKWLVLLNILAGALAEAFIAENLRKVTKSEMMGSYSLLGLRHCKNHYYKYCKNTFVSMMVLYRTYIWKSAYCYTNEARSQVIVIIGLIVLAFFLTKTPQTHRWAIKPNTPHWVIHFLNEEINTRNATVTASSAWEYEIGILLWIPSRQ